MITNKDRRVLAPFFLLALIAAVGWTNGQRPKPPAPGSPYYPLAVANWWQYSIHDSAASGQKSVTWRVAQVEELSGERVYHLWSSPPQGDESLDLVERANGLAEADDGPTLLRNPLTEGTSWTSKAANPAHSGTDTFKVESTSLDYSRSDAEKA